MTPTRLLACLAALRWSRRELAAAFGYAKSSVTQWLNGRAAVPAHVADWLERAAAWMDANPIQPKPPSGPGRRSTRPQ